MIDKLKAPAKQLLARTRFPPKRHIVEYDGATGKAVWEAYYDDARRYHRTSDRPAVIERDVDTGVVTRKEYYEHGTLHREGFRPSVIVRDPWSGLVIRAAYYIHGKYMALRTSADMGKSAQDKSVPSLAGPR
jgi:hypothetical protein